MRYVIFDTETGGFDPATDALVSLGAVLWTSGSGRVVPPAGEEFYRVVRDETGALHEGALRVNGFTREKIETEGQDPKDTWRDFITFCRLGGAVDDYGRIRLGGHNVGFDTGFLRRLARITGNGQRYEAIISHRTVCTMAVAGFLNIARPTAVPGTGKLLDLVARLGIPAQEAHNALGDARMAADLLTKFVTAVRA